jgi:hypothetical protein
MNLKKLYLPILVGFLCTYCTRDQLPANPLDSPACDNLIVAYELNVKAILDESCAYGGCHPGYNRFDNLLPILENGSFRSRVIELESDPNLGMPPDYAPSDRPRELTADQLELLACWLADNFPE